MPTTFTPRIPSDEIGRRLKIKIALVYLKRIKRALREYEEEVDAWYRSGPGRSPNWREEYDEESGEVYRINYGGEGYRFPTCIHGRSLWVDYDIPCGECEMGESNVYNLALTRGHSVYEDWLNRMSVVQYASDQNAPREIVSKLTEWAVEVLPEEWRKPE